MLVFCPTQYYRIQTNVDSHRVFILNVNAMATHSKSDKLHEEAKMCSCYVRCNMSALMNAAAHILKRPLSINGLHRAVQV